MSSTGTISVSIEPEYGELQDELGRIDDIISDVRSSHCTRGAGMTPMLDEHSGADDLSDALADVIDKVDDIRRILEDMDLDALIGLHVDKSV